jgi:hypothetical protein
MTMSSHWFEQSIVSNKNQNNTLEISVCMFKKSITIDPCAKSSSKEKLTSVIITLDEIKVHLKMI